MYTLDNNTAKQRLSVMLLVTIIMIPATISILQQQPYYQTAKAYPCVGGSAKEYCTGYHDGAIIAYRDFNTEHDLDTSQHPCTGNSTDYCNGYIRGYNDEADFLG
ncbi:MAG: hypothetical protein ACJ72R_05205 [Nitrososphaeraceae archaeon]